MAKFGGLFLKAVQTFLYAVEFCCAGIVLAIYSYFLSVLADRDIPIAAWKKAVEGMSGIAVVYTIFAVLLTCFLGGKTFFAFLAIVLDILFAAVFIAIAVLTRDGAGSCSGYVETPLGDGPEDADGARYNVNDNETVTVAVDLGLACRLNKAAFAVSIIAVVLFIISAAVQLALGRHHRKEKRFGPSPANNYTSGSGRRRFFWQRKNRTDPEHAGGMKNDRPSYETASTVPQHNGYHTAPTGTYGYERGTASNF
ncbi:hypothetical protein BDY21DRAFT_335621 [Lineolata rhizophorae]|uniref:Marvel domain-containing protein n=1 Tax=Lineolata rhizophorae TaxID=578093 RepID=A0A6A6P985_9PEZI|nr:hypothetical protein BDY21DRAFT_335621 [Lineolata rhizophorae]